MPTWRKLRNFVSRRVIRPFEHLVHNVVELLPLAAVLVVALLRDGGRALLARPQALAFAGATRLMNLVSPLGENLRCRRMTRRA